MEAQGGVATPYVGLALADEGARTGRLGTRWALGSKMSLNLEGTRRDAANDNEVDGAETGLVLSARFALGSNAGLNFEALRRESPNDDVEPQHAVGVRLTARW